VTRPPQRAKIESLLHTFLLIGGRMAALTPGARTSAIRNDGRLLASDMLTPRDAVRA
jgi:hypothetical protein